MESAKQNLISILRWSEKYTKTDMVYLFHGGFWLGGAQITTSIAGFLLTILLANVLAPEVLGEYRFLMTGLFIFSIFALPGMYTALLESTPKGWIGNLPPAFKSIKYYGILGSVCALFVSFYYFTKENNGLSIGFFIIALLLPLYTASQAYLEYLKALREFKRVTIYVTLSRIFLLTLTLSVALIFPNYGWAIIATFLLGTTIPNIFFHTKTVKNFSSDSQPSDPTLVSYAKHLTLISAFSLAVVQIDKILVWGFVGAEELAIFYIAYAIPQEIAHSLNIISTLAFPKFANIKKEILRATLLPKIWKFFGLTALVSILYILVCPIIFSTIFPQYENAVLFSQILAISIVSTAFNPIHTYFITVKATATLYKLSIIVPTIRLLLAIILIPIFGIWGAIYTILLEVIVIATSFIYFFLKS